MTDAVARRMKLDDLVKDIGRVQGDAAAEIGGIVYDSRKVKKGDLFVAIRGGKCDGHDFLGEAVRRGASAVVYERGGTVIEETVRTHPEVAWIQVADTRDALASLSCRLYGDPSRDISVIAITGTNGKTTTSYVIKAVLEKWGKQVGLIGTIQYMIKDAVYEAPHTTPESADLQRLLRAMADAGCQFAVSEVSSHALVQKRADYTHIETAVFTNLTRDHLDFHGSMEEYGKAKERLFTRLLDRGGTAVINVDDSFGRQLVRTLTAGADSCDRRRVITYSVAGTEAHLSVARMRTTMTGTICTVRVTSLGAPQEVALTSSLIGITNVYNILAAMGAALAVGVPVEAIIKGVAGMRPVRGRFESVDLGQPFLAVVDYAHTEDALDRLLTTARTVISRPSAGSDKRGGRLITVFGCGGDRDRGKRPKMGDVASRLSDMVIVTSDNPRNEDPREIIRDIEEGLRRDNYVIMPDRSAAITSAVMLASPGDCVVVAGKGHEEYQEVRDRRYRFSDREALEGAIKLVWRSSGRGAGRASKPSSVAACGDAPLC